MRRESKNLPKNVRMLLAYLLESETGAKQLRKTIE
jgi:hypothetical protein